MVCCLLMIYCRSIEHTTIDGQFHFSHHDRFPQTIVRGPNKYPKKQINPNHLIIFFQDVSSETMASFSPRCSCFMAAIHRVSARRTPQCWSRWPCCVSTRPCARTSPGCCPRRFWWWSFCEFWSVEQLNFFCWRNRQSSNRSKKVGSASWSMLHLCFELTTPKSRGVGQLPSSWTVLSSWSFGNHRWVIFNPTPHAAEREAIQLAELFDDGAVVSTSCWVETLGIWTCYKAMNLFESLFIWWRVATFLSWQPWHGHCNMGFPKSISRTCGCQHKYANTYVEHVYSLSIGSLPYCHVLSTNIFLDPDAPVARLARKGASRQVRRSLN